MIDAFGRNLEVGDSVIAIATLHTSQTLYRGTIIDFRGKECAVVEVMELSNVDTFWSSIGVDKWQVGIEKRVCVSHRLAKI